MKKQENVKMGDILQSNNGDSWVVVNVGVDVILIQNMITGYTQEITHVK